MVRHMACSCRLLLSPAKSKVATASILGLSLLVCSRVTAESYTADALLISAANRRRPAALDGKQSAGMHVRLLNSGCTGCTNSFGMGLAASVIVFRELESSLPAATCAAFDHPSGTFAVFAGKKLTVSAGHAASAAWHTAWHRAGADIADIVQHGINPLNADYRQYLTSHES